MPITEATSDKGQSAQDEALVAFVRNDVPTTVSLLLEGTMEGKDISIPAIPNIFPLEQDKKK